MKKKMQNWIRLWIILGGVIILCPIVFNVVSFMNLGSKHGYENVDFPFLLFITCLSVIPSFVLVGILGAILFWIDRQKRVKAEWSTVIEKMAEMQPNDITLPLNVKVKFQDPLSDAKRGLISQPLYFGIGSVTITDVGFALEGIPKSWGFLFGGIGSSIAAGATGKRKYEIPKSSIVKMQCSMGNVLGATPVVFNVFHRQPSESKDCVCSFTLVDISDFDQFWLGLESQIPPEKLIQPKASLQKVK